MVNIHHEELPALSKCSKYNMATLQYSPNTGFTIHKVDKNIDTGDILLKIRYQYSKNLRETVYFIVQL